MVIGTLTEPLCTPLYECMWDPALSHGGVSKDSGGVPIAVPFFYGESFEWLLCPYLSIHPQ